MKMSSAGIQLSRGEGKEKEMNFEKHQLKGPLSYNFVIERRIQTSQRRGGDVIFGSKA